MLNFSLEDIKSNLKNKKHDKFVTKKLVWDIITEYKEKLEGYELLDDIEDISSDHKIVIFSVCDGNIGFKSSGKVCKSYTNKDDEDIISYIHRWSKSVSNIKYNKNIVFYKNYEVPDKKKKIKKNKSEKCSSILKRDDEANKWKDNLKKNYPEDYKKWMNSKEEKIKLSNNNSDLYDILFKVGRSKEKAKIRDIKKIELKKNNRDLYDKLYPNYSEECSIRNYK